MTHAPIRATIGARIAALKKDPDGPHGYDHCYCLRSSGSDLTLAAQLAPPRRWRTLHRLREQGATMWTGVRVDAIDDVGVQANAAFYLMDAMGFSARFPETLEMADDDLHVPEVDEAVVVRVRRSGAVKKPTT